MQHLKESILKKVSESHSATFYDLILLSKVE